MSFLKLSATDQARLKACITPSRAGVPTSASKQKGKKQSKGDAELPDFRAPEPKTAGEMREWDRMSSRMEGFHSYFRQSFQQLWILASQVGEGGLPLRQYLTLAEELGQHLEGHHGIEERYIFPVLAQRMPEFASSGSAEHLEEHKAIHAGMEKLERYVASCKAKAGNYEPEAMRAILQCWGPILFYHLDAEVRTLHRNNLRRYYTLEEVRKLPM